MNNQILPITKEQAEKLAELGDRLHRFRQDQRISLEKVAAQTMIPTRILAAIESGKSDQLPEPVYIQGFIKRYADAIGMDGTELANDFPAQAPFRPATMTWRGTVQAQLRPLHLYLLYMALVVSAVSGLSYLMHRSGTQVVGTANTNQNPIQPAPSVAPGLPNGPFLSSQKASLIPGAISSQPEMAAKDAKSVRVGLTLTAQSWIRVVADGKTQFEGVLPEGTQRSWEADKQLTLRAGNAGGVMVTFNNGQAKRLGEPGSVEEVTYGTNSQAASQSSAGSPALTALKPETF